MSNSEITVENGETSPKRSWFKKIIITLLVVYVIFYVFSAVNLSKIQTQTKQHFVASNNALLPQGISIDHIVTSLYADGNNIYNFKVNNPANFLTPYLLQAPDIRINSAFSADPTVRSIIITSVVIKNAEINYEMNGQKEINLYKTLETIVAKLSPSPNYSPLAILSSAWQPATPLNYSGTRFYLGDVILEKPIINVYNTGTLLKRLTTQNIILSFKGVKQPVQYGDALLAGSLQLVDSVDKIVKQG